MEDGDASSDRKTIKESDLVRLWLWKFHRESPQWQRVRLGSLPDKEGARLLLVTLRWADAVFVENGAVHIVEAKLVPNAGAIGQLLQYHDLLPHTPEFSAYRNMPIRLILLVPFVALDIVEMASKHDIDYEVFTLDEALSVRKVLKRPLK